MWNLEQPRFVAIPDWERGCIAWEAKALVPSSSMWVADSLTPPGQLDALLFEGLVRSLPGLPRTPFQLEWVFRLLARRTRSFV